MVSSLINANPIVYEIKERRTRIAPDDVNEDIKDLEHPYSLEELKVMSEDAIEVDDKHNCVRDIKDPEHPYSLEELKVISEDAIEVDDKHNVRREQLKKSGLGKVIMFLLKSDEETTAN
ncbi:Protein AE7 [Camellia lanceoleosa]|uniref:Protein AE7 n=1 Tax=Camellia lanceoleosa TaxID=1840588 RepID=A0ACC0FYM4_9ERIC|nr:Protein AE7 [Camellia lanceoleosa]